jgi:hypothetical protein
MTDKPDGETTSSAANKPGKGRQRPQPVVDLPPDAVKDITTPAEPAAAAADQPVEAPIAEARPDPVPEAQATLSEAPMPPQEAAVAANQAEPEPSSPMPPPAPAAARPSLVLPVMAGLVAGLIGGVATSQLLPRFSGASPSTDPALVGRVAQLEQQARAVKPGEPVPPAVAQKLQQLDALMAELPKREAALKAEIASLRQALDSRPMPLASAPSVPPAEIDAMKTRIGTLEDGLKAVPQGVNQLGARIDTLQPRLETVARDLQGLSSRVGGLGARDSLSSANARLAAVTLAEDAFSKGRPLAPALDLLKGLVPDPARLAPLQPFAEAGPAAPADLVKAMKAAAPKEAAPAPSTLSFAERLKQSALSFVEIRKTGDISGADDQSALRRAEQAVMRGDLAGALTATAKLSPAAAPAYAGWRDSLERQIKARDALVALRQEAMEFLARTAQAAR